MSPVPSALESLDISPIRVSTDTVPGWISPAPGGGHGITPGPTPTLFPRENENPLMISGRAQNRSLQSFPPPLEPIPPINPAASRAIADLKSSSRVVGRESVETLGSSSTREEENSASQLDIPYHGTSSCEEEFSSSCSSQWAQEYPREEYPPGRRVQLPHGEVAGAPLQCPLDARGGGEQVLVSVSTHYAGGSSASYSSGAPGSCWSATSSSGASPDGLGVVGSAFKVVPPSAGTNPWGLVVSGGVSSGGVSSGGVPPPRRGGGTCCDDAPKGTMLLPQLLVPPPAQQSGHAIRPLFPGDAAPQLILNGSLKKCAGVDHSRDYRYNVLLPRAPPEQKSFLNSSLNSTRGSDHYHANQQPQNRLSPLLGGERVYLGERDTRFGKRALDQTTSSIGDGFGTNTSALSVVVPEFAPPVESVGAGPPASTAVKRSRPVIGTNRHRSAELQKIPKNPQPPGYDRPPGPGPRNFRK